MWFSKVLNPERWKKIKANRETFSFKSDKLIIYNFFFITTFSVYSKLLTAFQDQFAFVNPFPAGLVTGWETSKDATCCQEHKTKNYILMPKNADKARHRFC